jgi:hypothetical protein
MDSCIAHFKIHIFLNYIAFGKIDDILNCQNGSELTTVPIFKELSRQISEVFLMKTDLGQQKVIVDLGERIAKIENYLDGLKSKVRKGRADKHNDTMPEFNNGGNSFNQNGGASGFNGNGGCGQGTSH